MSRFPVSLEGKRILISNDDGINAEGIRTLEEVARQFTDDVWVVAPETQQSATSHALTIHRPLRINKMTEKKFCIDGTPTDCVMVAVKHILADKKPDVIFSGINHGGNLADDITYSGTVAAAMEGTILGVPSIAFSQFMESEKNPDAPRNISFDGAKSWAPKVIERILGMEIDHDLLVNVNFPAVEAGTCRGIKVTMQGKRHAGDTVIERLDPKGRPYLWLGNPSHEHPRLAGTDVDTIEKGYITVTPLTLNMTDHRNLKRFEKLFA